jgi:peptide chain release factor 2
MQNLTLNQRILRISQSCNKVIKLAKLDSINQTISSVDQKISDNNNWSNHELMSSLQKEKISLQRKISDLLTLQSDVIAMNDLLKDVSESEIEEFEPDISSIEKKITLLTLKASFTDDKDYCSAFLELNSGAGGTESQDWVKMLVRMYSMWAESQNFQCEIIDSLSGEEVGFKNITLKISGELAFGWLKVEAGVHRLVRISPFNANGKRQTSFASVFVYPDIDDKINIEILQKDLKIDTFRSSGAGGQHVNKTDSAVRITHTPSGIVVSCQNGRSQVQNKTEAMKMLKAKLYKKEQEIKQTEINKVNSQKSDISFGSQIRNYTLQPYQLIKDARSGWEMQNAHAFLDGKIQECIESVIAHNASQ